MRRHNTVVLAQEKWRKGDRGNEKSVETSKIIRKKSTPSEIREIGR